MKFYTITKEDVRLGAYFVQTPYGRLPIQRLLVKFEKSDVGRVIWYELQDDGTPDPHRAWAK